MKADRMALAPLLLLALAAAPAACGLHGKPEVKRSATPSAAPGPASAAVPGDRVVAPGIVEPWGGAAELSSREPGWIARVAVKEGDRVAKGQLLVALDDEPQRHQVGVAAAELAEAEAALARAEAGATPEELAQASADRVAAAARSDLARSAEARARQLHQQRVVSDSEADRAAAEAQAQGALAARAEARLAELVRGARPEDRQAARARARAARERLRLASARLEQRRVVAPEPGTVLLSRFHEGEFYAAGAGPLLVLGDLGRLQVRLEVDEVDALSLSVGAPCALVSDGGAPLAQGVVLRLAPRMGRRGLATESPTARSDVRVREVFVEIPADARLIPGQRVWGHVSPVAPGPERLVRDG